MGATFWEHFTPFEADATTALLRAQADVYRDAGHDLAALLDRRIADMDVAAKSCEDDDPYGLLDHYRDCADRLRHLAARGVPNDTAACIAILREIEAIGSDCAPGILAVEGISADGEPFTVEPLTADRLQQLFGTSTPSMREYRERVAGILDAIDRGQACCFPIFENGRPVSWCFVGLTAD